MQIPDMKALKSIYNCNHVLLLNPINASNSVSFQSHRIPQFFCQLNSTAANFYPEESSFAIVSSRTESNSSESGNSQDSETAARKGWSIYSPALGRAAVQGSLKKRDEEESELGFLSLDKKIEDSERERSCGIVKEGNLNGGDETHVGLPSFNEVIIDDVLKGNGYNGVKKENLSEPSKTEGLLKGKSYNGVKMETLGNGDKTRMPLSNYRGENKNSMNEKRFGSVKMGGFSGDIFGNKKKVKSKVSYVCENCGYSDGKWWGVCHACRKTGTMKKFLEVDSGNGGKARGMEVSERAVQSWLPQPSIEVHPIRLADVNQGMKQSDWRIPLPGLFGSEVARVLGGGLVPGSLVLVGGDPGVGKSTLLLQIAAIISEGQDVGEPAPVVYVSGEESIEQIGNRADRMGIETKELFLYSSTDIEDILKKIQPLSPRVLIVDSIQTVFLKGVTGSAGGIYQVRECTSALLRFAKTTKIPVLLTGHVTKSGDIAGPRVLEHIVDAVLYMEGEKYSSHRLLRPVKNRFGSTDELGVFEMAQVGLQAVTNPSEIFLGQQHSNSEVLAGLAVTVMMDGSRSFLIEVQALCVSSPSVSRHVNGIQMSRADMIISVLMKQAGLMLQHNAVFLNVISGVTLTETAGDLAIAAAICSSFLEYPIPNNVAFIGEIGLGGELRSVPRMEKRVNTVAKLGYSMCIVPKSTAKSLANLGFEGMKIIGCNDVKEVFKTLFKGKQN